MHKFYSHAIFPVFARLHPFGADFGNGIKLRNLGVRSGEFCVSKLIVSNNAGKISAIHPTTITKLVTSPSKLSGGGGLHVCQTEIE